MSGTVSIVVPAYNESAGLAATAEAILAALAFAACLAWTITTLIGTNKAEPSVPRATETEVEPPEAPIATAESPERETKIPDVSGRSLEEAVKLLSGAGFEVAAIKTETSRRAPETAIRTNPTSGTPAKPGAPVTLTMSTGPAVATSSATATATAAGTACRSTSR